MIYYFEVFARSLIVADGPNWLMIFLFEAFARQSESYLKHGPSNQKDCRCFCAMGSIDVPRINDAPRRTMARADPPPFLLHGSLT
jgi:hypothetical protein